MMCRYSWTREQTLRYCPVLPLNTLMCQYRPANGTNWWVLTETKVLCPL